MIAFRVGPLILDIADGDIAAQTTDAVVNAANNAFWMGSGVTGALKRRHRDTTGTRRRSGMLALAGL
jgi:O-acetyl-ADP-ribose deacetylase (regulator of RNase III)